MSESRVISRLDDWINPIAMKEMRQAVKGRFVVGMLLFYLLIQLVIIGAVLLFQENPTENFNLGRGLFMGLLSALLATGIFFIPAYTALRFSSERSENNVDLFFITTMHPRQIIWGKLASSMLLVLLFFSASLPFLTLTYLLRGLDLPSMFLVLSLDFLVVTGCTQFAIMLASFPGKLMLRFIRFALGAVVLALAFYLTSAASIQFVLFGIGSSLTSWDFWRTALFTVSIILLAIGLFFVLSMTAITPKTANKAFPLRVYLVLVWLITGFFSSLCALQLKEEGFLGGWAISMTMIFSFHLLAAVCERQNLGPRVRRKIPNRLFSRALVYPFYSGAASGIVFSVLMLLLTVVATFLISQFDRVVLYEEELFIYSFVPGIYAFCYAMTAFAIRRWFFRKAAEPTVTALLAGILFFLGCAGPPMIAFLMNDGQWRGIPEQWFIANPYAIFWERRLWDNCIAFSSIWAIMAAAITLPWLVRKIAGFVPFRAEETQSAEVTVMLPIAEAIPETDHE